MAEPNDDIEDTTQEILEDLHTGIDVGRKIVSANHDFYIKLLAAHDVFARTAFKYPHIEDIFGLFVDVSDELRELEEELKKLGYEEIHVVRKEKAAERHGVGWILKHMKKVGKELQEEKDVDKEIIEKIHSVLVKIKKLFIKAEHLFSIHEEEARVKEVKIKLEEEEKEIKDIVEKLIQFLFSYEKMFRELLKELEG